MSAPYCYQFLTNMFGTGRNFENRVKSPQDASEMVDFIGRAPNGQILSNFCGQLTHSLSNTYHWSFKLSKLGTKQEPTYYNKASFVKVGIIINPLATGANCAIQEKVAPSDPLSSCGPRCPVGVLRLAPECMDCRRGEGRPEGGAQARDIVSSRRHIIVIDTAIPFHCINH